MSVSPTTRRQAWNTSHTEKDKPASGRAKSKNATHAQANMRKKDETVEFGNVFKKPKTKRCSSTDTHSKSRSAIDEARAYDAPRSRGATFSHASSSTTQGQVYSDAHDKAAAHRKANGHRAAKKSDSHKTRPVKHSNSEQNLPETEEAVITAVSQSFDHMSFENWNDETAN